MKPEEKKETPKKEARPGLTDNYTPAANVLIQGFSELSISERYVAIGLVSLYWDEKVYPVSLRELAAKIQINHTTLRSRAGKRPAEGILDKLWRLGIIGLLEGKPTTETGNKGRVQTYLRVNHRFIAERNSDCTQGKKAKTPRYTVGTTNSSTDDATVGNDNDNVGSTNHTVGDTNDTVGNTNHTVVHVSVESPPKNNKNSKNFKETEESFLPQDEEFSDSQTIPPTEEKKEVELQSAQQRIAELEQQLALSQAESLRLQENKAHQSINVPSQTPLLPEPPKPENKHNIPDLRAGLNERDPRQLTPAEQKRIDASAAKEQAKALKLRKEDIWTLYGKLTGSNAIRDLWSEKAVNALTEGDATDEQITLTYNTLKKKGQMTTLSYIASHLNSYGKVEETSASTSAPQPAKKRNFTQERWDRERALAQQQAIGG